MDASLQELIVTDLELRGSGTRYSPIRRITQIWDREGDLIAEFDPLLHSILKEFASSLPEGLVGDYVMAIEHLKPNFQ